MSALRETARFTEGCDGALYIHLWTKNGTSADLVLDQDDDSPSGLGIALGWYEDPASGKRDYHVIELENVQQLIEWIQRAHANRRGADEPNPAEPAPVRAESEKEGR